MDIHTDVFRGTVTNVQNIRVIIGNGRGDHYRALVTVKVSNVLRGDLAVGDEVTVMYQNAITSFAAENGYMTSTMDFAGETEVGMDAIFNAMKYNKDSFLSYDGIDVPLMEIAKYGLPDDRRFIFFQTDNGILYADEAMPSLKSPANLDDVEAWLGERLN
jgi:hypothetical protein